MADHPRVVQISGHGRPSAALLRRFGVEKLPDGVRLGQVLDETLAIDVFAKLLTEAMEKEQQKGGLVDMRDVAAYVLRQMKNST